MKYFIFDVDGTLLNSAEVDQQCLQQMLREFGQEHTLEELRPSFGKPGRQTLADLGFSGEAAERAMDRWEGLSQERIAEVRVFNGVEAMLKALHERGCRCGIVTSRTHYQYGYGFSPLGLDGYFDAVICMEDAPRTKPAPDPLLECLRRMGGLATAGFGGLRGRAVTLGAILTAAAAGVASCLALWGCLAPDRIAADVRLAAPGDVLSLI